MDWLFRPKTRRVILYFVLAVLVLTGLALFARSRAAADVSAAAADLPAGGGWSAFPEGARPSSRVAVLNTGFAGNLLQSLFELGEPATMLDIDFDPIQSAERYPVLVIPSGGLYGLENATSVRVRLEEYARRGGLVAAFSQQHGYEYAALPTPADGEGGEGGALAGYGWSEDINCQRDSSAVANFAPMLLGQDKEVLSLNVDGYFTAYPRQATVLLTRIINGQPSMLAYPYGEGWVLVTSTYADMAYYMGQGTDDERAFVRDLAAWALNPTMQVDRYGGEDVVTIPVTLTNSTVVPAPTASQSQHAHRDPLDTLDTLDLVVALKPTLLAFRRASAGSEHTGGESIEAQKEWGTVCVGWPCDTRQGLFYECLARRFEGGSGVICGPDRMLTTARRKLSLASRCSGPAPRLFPGWQRSAVRSL